MKVFAMNDCDWMAGETLEAAKAAYAQDYDGEDSAEAHELTGEEMDQLRVSDPDAEPPIDGCSFREMLDRLVNQGQEFPCFFASTEY